MVVPRVTLPGVLDVLWKKLFERLVAGFDLTEATLADCPGSVRSINCTQLTPNLSDIPCRSGVGTAGGRISDNAWRRR